MMELGIKPVYVFDGKAPDLKSVELAAREEKKQQAELELKAARESGDAEEIRKASHRSVCASRPAPHTMPHTTPRALPRALPRGSRPLHARAGAGAGEQVGLSARPRLAGARDPTDERGRAGAAAAARLPGRPRAVRGGGELRRALPGGQG